ncbi:flagellar protein FliS [Sporosarcina sp. USHLN248]|uniref:flagellar protein FliS n=1 Tax=Sporosarcina sp. USHLN248 TaxID=3081300 RepID=UPI003015D39D
MYTENNIIDIEKAIEIYRESNMSTLSMMEYVILLLNGLRKNVQLCGEAIIANNAEQLDHSLQKAQQFIFELMTTIDHDAEDSEKHLLLYIHLNQCLVNVKLTKTDRKIAHVDEIIQQLIASWEVAKQVTRRRNFQTDQL